MRADEATTRESHNAPIGAIIRDIVDSFRNMVRGEIHLAKAEARQSVHEVGRHLAFVIFFGVVALAGILPLTAALVIYLGNAMNGNYALSALIVGAALMVIGAFVAIRFAVRIKEMDLSLPRTRESLKSETELIDHELHRFREPREPRKWRVS